MGNYKTDGAGNHEGLPQQLPERLPQRLPQRRSIRLKGYDYSQAGLYFVTIVTKNRECLFGEIVNDEMILNDAGKMIKKEGLKIPERFKNIKLNEYIIMPNHFHAILETVGATLVVARNANDKRDGQPQGIAPTIAPTEISPSISDIIGAFKSITTVEYIRGVKTKKWQQFDGKLWQRNYWEHIIRNEKSHNTLTDYIKNNPYNWCKDTLNQ